jgi:mannose-6-phosphate isomerase-like protein (cupin superfamily)
VGGKHPGCMSSRAKELDREKIAQDWQARGFSCDLWVDPPGQVWEDYVHATDELLMLVEGKLELEMQGKTFRPDIGEEVLIPARTSHTVRSSGGTTARWLYGYKS